MMAKEEAGGDCGITLRKIRVSRELFSVMAKASERANEVRDACKAPVRFDN